MKKYEHQFQLSYNGDSVGTIQFVIIKSCNKIIKKSIFLEEVQKQVKEKYIGRYDFTIDSHIVFEL